jgi:hypothetical protein
MIDNLNLRRPRRVALVTFESAHLDLYEFNLFLASPVLIAPGPITTLLGGLKYRLL